MSRTEAQHYELVMRDAKDSVFLVAVRQAIDTRLLVVEFDAGQESGPRQEHTLTISLRETSLAVKADGIPHDWLPVGTGFIDTRFSRLVSGQLAA